MRNNKNKTEGLGYFSQGFSTELNPLVLLEEFDVSN